MLLIVPLEAIQNRYCGYEGAMCGLRIPERPEVSRPEGVLVRPQAFELDESCNTIEFSPLQRQRAAGLLQLAMVKQPWILATHLCSSTSPTALFISVMPAAKGTHSLKA